MWMRHTAPQHIWLTLNYIKFSRSNENLDRIDLNTEAINTGLIVVMANTEDSESLLNSKELKIAISVSLELIYCIYVGENFVILVTIIILYSTTIIILEHEGQAPASEFIEIDDEFCRGFKLSLSSHSPSVTKIQRIDHSM